MCLGTEDASLVSDRKVMQKKKVWVSFQMFFVLVIKIKYLWLIYVSKKLNLPGRWLEIAHTRQCDVDHHPARGDRALKFILYHDSACVSWVEYLIFGTVSMPVHRMYVQISAHSHQVPVDFITNFHVQTIEIAVHLSIDGCVHKNGRTF